MSERDHRQAPSPDAVQAPGRGEGPRRSTGLASPIASGRTADVHPWDEGHILKLYRRGTSLETVEYERQKMAVARGAGLPVPAASRVVEVEGRFGLVVEWLDGRPMLEALLHEPEAVEPMARRLASLHLELHAHPGPATLPDQRALLRAKLARGTLLSEAEQAAALAALDRLPGGDRLCHGDFHPGNVILTKRGPFIIDWLDASRGNPIADVARAAMIFLGHAQNPGLSSRLREAITRYSQLYLEAYFQHAPDRRAEVRQWLPVLAAARLSEGLEEQREWLLQVARAGLARGEFTPSLEF